MNPRKAMWHVVYVLRKTLRGTGVTRLAVARSMVGVLGRQFLWWIIARVSSRRPILVQGHRMFVLSVAPTVLFSPDMMADRFEEGTTALFRRVLREGMVVVDVGAHVGYYTLLAAKQTGRRGKVYAFEAEPATYQLLVRNIELNKYRNIIAVGKAVADSTGVLNLYLSNRTGRGVQRYNRIYCVGGHEQILSVQATTLDDFFKEQGWPRIDFIKMDIDGAEARALQGMRCLMEKADRLRLVTEFYPEGLQASGTNPREFLHNLEALGFYVRLIAAGGKVEAFDPETLLGKLRGSAAAVNLLCER